MIATIVIILILLVIACFALKGTIKHLKGEGDCCGGGSSCIAEEDKKLEGPVISEKIIKIEGMHCDNCVNRVKRALNKIDGVSARVNLKKGEATVQLDRDVEDEVLIRAIENQDFQVNGIIKI